MKELDPQDQAPPTSTYHNAEIAQLHEDGLLSRWEADVSDVLMTKGVTFAAQSSSNGVGQSPCHHEQTQRVLISQIYMRCLWNDIPLLQRWITQFLAGRQPDATIVAAGMAKHGVTRMALADQHIEGYLVIGSVGQELHGSVAEYMAEHLAHEGKISGYAVYTIPLLLGD